MREWLIVAVLVLAAYFAEPWLSWVVVFVSVAFVIVWRLVGQAYARASVAEHSRRVPALRTR